jgi:amino acid transporter
VGTAPGAAPESGGDAHGILRAVLVVIFALQGFEIVPLLAGSVHRSESSVPFATVGSLLFAAVLYAGLHALAARAVPGLAKSGAPLVDAARAYGGTSVASVVALGANVSAVGIAFGMFNTTPRYLSALSKPGAFGPWIGEVDGRYVPQRALWLTAAVVVVAVAAADKPDELFVLSSLAVLTQYATALGSLGVLAWRRSYGLSRGQLGIVVLSVVGIVLASHGAEPKELFAIAVVAVVGEALRRIGTRRSN